MHAQFKLPTTLPKSGSSEAAEPFIFYVQNLDSRTVHGHYNIASIFVTKV